MGLISNITVKNIKGFSDRDNSIDVDIKSGKINILVAPNGYGKSSITAAFKSLTNSKIKVEKEDIYKENEQLESSLSITEDGNIYTADQNKNELANHFKVAVVNSRLVAKAAGKNMGTFHSVQGHLGINDFEIRHKIPTNCNILYRIQNIRSTFGKNGKVLSKISSLLVNNAFLSQLDNIYSDLDKQSAKKRQDNINEIIQIINGLHGTVENIINTFNVRSLDKLKQDSSYNNVVELIKKYIDDTTELELFLYFYQIQKIYIDEKTNLKAKVQRAKYELFKQAFDNNLAIIGKTWKDIHTMEDGGSLVIKMPNATNISYGQRDVLTLSIELLKIKSEIKDDCKLILIIDEVFDYLDPVNMTIVQYYFSQLVNEFKDKCTLYPIIMTHLSPDFFNNYTFSPKRMNIIYLQKDYIQPNANVKKLLSKRGEKTIENDVAKFLLHYHEGEINQRENFKQLKLAETWGEGTTFLEHLINEMNKYLRKDADYDPYSVCIALRIKIEKSVYEQLPTEDEKEKFIETHGTKEKLEFAENILGELPDIYFILGVIYNDAGHLKDENSEKPVVYRLNNHIIQNMISEIFEYQGVDLTIDSIH
ncbi:hypothetical protein [Porphyromonas gingivalis]|uniref:hypothetical protein n=1 Tax=Porphyromonas gingivalis TaxID=837 RepID=UPI00097CDE50|nr:hypothetical protein [Porphyromonas gingivalis]SJM17379.1 hypothetical protein PGIN_15-9_00304 [Porphyromonas gingivalis]